ncbi:Hypp8910 [Branchiostoma lanceolatum]|uniref:Hypp8910 protein n=1 Tax=Branchiostoma lanceolatum TaxID=7740 RepID=A0A8J9ZA73_BRALA|nr:Hypp8910 [Branchiostoma lanceolatum]
MYWGRYPGALQKNSSISSCTTLLDTMPACRVLWVAFLVCHATSLVTAAPSGNDIASQTSHASLKKEVSQLEASYKKCEKSLMEANNMLEQVTNEVQVDGTNKVQVDGTNEAQVDGTNEVQADWALEEELEQMGVSNPYATSAGSCVDDDLAERLLSAISDVQRTVNKLRSGASYHARNLAEHKHARQFRTKYRSEAGLAVDGNANPD